MFRWSSLIARVVILILIATAIWIGRDPLTRKALISTGESMVGAKVEIGHVRTSLSDGQVYLKQVAIADPRDPMKNLMQADSALLRLNSTSLLQRRFVVEDGIASQVVFGAPRSNSGGLGHLAAPLDEQIRPSVTVEPANQDPRADWLDRFQYAGPVLETGPWELDRMSVELFRRWDTDLQQQVAEIQDLKSRIRQIHDTIPRDSNPLRIGGQIQQARTQLEALQDEIKLRVSQLTELDRQLAADRNLLLQARQEDEKKILSRTRQRSLDGDVITQVLLNRNQIELAEEILDLFFKFRSAVPDPKHDFRPAEEIGRTLSVRAIEPVEPGFLVKSMQLDGSGHLAGVKFSFSGTVKNISDRPALLDEPVSFDLRAQGNTHVIVRCTLDRSTEFRNDSIFIHCPDLPTPAKTLGDPESLLMNVSPCRTQLAVELQSRNGGLSGEFKFDHTNLVMQIERLDPQAGGDEVASRINLELASICQYSIVATIAGTVSNPTVRFQSDLGDQLAAKFNESVHRQSQSVLHRLQGMYEAQVAKLESDVEIRVRDVQRLLQNEIVDQKASIVAELKRQLPDDPRIRPFQR